MALLDRFRRPPQWKHEDPLVRIAGVEELPLDQQVLLIAIAREDADVRVRRAAVRKIIEPSAVAEVARSDRDESVRNEAIGILRDLALGVFENTTESESLAALALLTDVRDIITVAESASLEPVWRAAIGQLDDPRALAAVARRASLPAARLEALQRLADPAEVYAVAVKSEHKDVAVAAVDRITDREALKAVAAKAAVRVAARRARALLEAQERPGVEAPSPEDLAAQAAQVRQLDLCRQVELLAKAGGVSSELAARVAQAEAAWAALPPGGGPELAQRFDDACRAAHGRIARVVAEEAGRSRLAEETAAAVAARLALCESVATIDGEDAPARLEEARAAWRSLQPMPAGQDADEAGALARRFEEAAAACARRQARRLAARALRQRAEETCLEVDQIAESARFPEAASRWAAVSRAWRELGAAGCADEDLKTRFSQAEEKFKAREAAAREQEARQRQGNLERLRRQCERLEKMLANPSLTLKDAERGLRDLRSALDSMPILPQKQDHDEMNGRVKVLHSSLMPKVQELREIDEWQRWANAGIQEQLCHRTEALRDVADVVEVARQLREIQEEWKAASLAPREKAQALWTRFKAAADEARARCDAYFTQQAEERGANVARKEALWQQAEALAESTDWLATAEAIKALQAEWKTIGPVPRGQEKAAWERFRRACDRFFTRRHEDLARRKEVWAANLAQKLALCERVEAAASSTDWEKGIEEIKRAQAEWKAVGPVRKNRAEAVWERFRSACDLFNERYRERDNAKLAAERAEREALCAELETLGSAAVSDDATGGEPLPPPGDLAERVLGIRNRWLEMERAGSAARTSGSALSERFAAALERVIALHAARFAGTPLDPDAARHAMLEICERIEGLVGTARPAPDGATSTAAMLAQQLREALASNTIGGRPTPADVESRWAAAHREIKAAQAEWRALSPVPGDAGRSLARRFQQACQRLAHQHDRELRSMRPAGAGSGLPRGSATQPRRDR